MDAAALRARIEEHVRRDLIPPGGEVVCLVSGGADSTCLWHALGELGYRASALHVNHGLRGEEAEADARFCAENLGAEIVEAPPAGRGTEAELRDLRYAVTAGPLRATGHTASDQVETIVYRLSLQQRDDRDPRASGGRRSSPAPDCLAGRDGGLLPRRGLAFRVDSTNPETLRGLIRAEILPALRRLHPAAERNVLAALEEGERPPRNAERALLELLASREGSKRLDLGDGRVAVREYESVWLEPGPGGLRGSGALGRLDARVDPAWAARPGLAPGDRLAGHGKKVQDVFVDAKVPGSEREAWPLVVRGDEVVAVPGIARPWL